MGSGPPPLENHKLYGFLYEISNWTPPPPEKSWTPPLENVGPPLEPWKMIDFFEIDHLTSVK